MFHIRETIKGVPYGQRAVNQTDARKWSQEIIKQTENTGLVTDACLMRITFKLPHDKFPPDFPFGNDLDNLLKRFFDALSHTVFKEAKGKDSCVVALEVMKCKVEKDPGVDFEILPIKVG